MSILPTFLHLVPKGTKMRLVKDAEGDPEFWNGRLLVWELPARGETYAIGVDCGEGVLADRSVAEVIRLGKHGKPDTQVAEFASNTHGPAGLAPIVASLGRFYSDPDGGEAMVTAEANALGQVLLQDIRLIHDYSNLYVRRQYDRFDQVWVNKVGFYTNKQTRPALIARGNHALHENQLRPVSEFLLDEMEDFEGDWLLAIARAKSGRHDDRVMAFMLAYWGAHEEEWAAGEDPVEERHRLAAAAQLQQAEAERARTKPDFQNTAVTYEQMKEWADEELFG